MASILTDIKKLLGLGEDYTAFDTDISIHINSALMAANQIGVGPATGLRIANSEATWDDLDIPGDLDLEAIKTWVYLKVRLVFDPPQNSFVTQAIEKQIDELTWRLTVQADNYGQ